MVITVLLSCLLTVLLAVFTWRLRRALRLFRVRGPYSADGELPSVSVCIPARNEDHAMTDCLENILASDYEKMEIIVFDDSSKDDTSALIRSFAYAGVRFIPGDTLPEGWLGKNYALEMLAREANGTYIIFLDVDTRVDKAAIGRLVEYIVAEKLAMVSVIPGRIDTWRASALFGTLRYFWQLVLLSKATPATSGALWIIDRSTLVDTMKGFERYKNTVQPEAHIAATLGPNAYHCLLGHKPVQVTYEKKWSSQLETGRRLLYPMAGGTWWRAIVPVGGLIVLNMPLLALLSAAVMGWTEVQAMGLWFTLLYMALYAVYLSHMWSQQWWLGAMMWPLVLLQELLLLISSMWGYARHTITWKGRLVTKGSVKPAYLKIDQ